VEKYHNENQEICAMPMTDGDRHELFGYLAAALGTAACIATLKSPNFTATFALGSTFAVLYLSPDLNQFRSEWGCKALHRWGFLWSVWGAYLSLVPYSHHRGITHWGGIGAVVIGWPFVLPLVLMGWY
jgi:uncharacterized metal-binding protein